MPMRADVAARFNGVEKTLAGFLVALVDVPVLAKARTALCLPSQIVEVSGVESFHDLFNPSRHESSDDLANRSVDGKLPLEETATTVWQIVSL